MNNFMRLALGLPLKISSTGYISQETEKEALYALFLFLGLVVGVLVAAIVVYAL